MLDANVISVRNTLVFLLSPPITRPLVSAFSVFVHMSRKFVSAPARFTTVYLYGTRVKSKRNQ